MYCNHRNSRNPGACRNCWRFSIVLWCLMFLGILIVPFFSDRPINPLHWVIVSVVGLLIGHSILTRWTRGD